MKKEHGILYSPAMVKAKLSGRKTVTRRIITPHNCVTSIAKKYLDWDHDNIIINGNLGIKLTNKQDGTVWRSSCKWQPGDLLYGRESGWVHNNYQPGLNDSELVVGGNLFFKADNPGLKDKGWIKEHYRFFPSIHMPKVFARIWDEVVSVRAERLHEITEEDAIAEGIEWVDKTLVGGEVRTMYKHYCIPGGLLYNPIDSYQTLWESINGLGSWEKNLVWRVVTKPYRK